jgi:hypothetical protein
MEKALLDQNPIKGYERIVDSRKRKFSKKKKNAVPHELPFDVVDATEQFCTWLNSVNATLPTCYDIKNKAFKTCTCLQEANCEALAIFMVLFASEPKASRQTVLKGLVQAANAMVDAGRTVTQEGHNTAIFKQPYRIPFPNEISGNLCSHGLKNLFFIREAAWKTIRESAKTGKPGPILHKNIMNKHRAINSIIMATKPSLKLFFEELGEKQGEPYATRFVRESTGIGVRESQIDVVELPSSFRKRDMYSRFCYQQGHVAKATAKGDYGKVKDFAKRVDDEWPVDLQPGPICDWRCFRDYWDSEYPNIRIRPTSQDTCGECYVWRNRVKFGIRDPDDENYNSEGDPVDLVQEAAAHVEQANAMRLAVQARTATAQHDYQTSVPHGQRSYAIVADYCQNLDLPHMGEEQPCETYYLSPKKVYCFGVVDLAVTPSKLYAYTYEEETGRKGGNNVASLLMLHLQ